LVIGNSIFSNLQKADKDFSKNNCSLKKDSTY